MSEPLSAEELAQLQADYERALNMPESVTAAKRVHVTKSDDNWWVGFGKDESCQIEGTQNHWRWLALVLLGLASQQDTPYSEDKPTPEPISRLLATLDAKDAEIARLREAIGLATTAAPTLEMDASDPVGMMQRVVAEVTRLRAEADALADALARALEAVSEDASKNHDPRCTDELISGFVMENARAALRAYREPGSPAIHTKYLDDQLVERCITCLERWPCKEPRP